MRAGVRACVRTREWLTVLTYRLAMRAPALPPPLICAPNRFLGNGECYEMMLHDFQSLASFSGMNILVFNYRGVNHSEGRLVQAWDLVEDGRLCK